jgi:hypothetical protein
MRPKIKYLKAAKPGIHWYILDVLPRDDRPLHWTALLIDVMRVEKQCYLDVGRHRSWARAWDRAEALVSPRSLSSWTAASWAAARRERI